MKISELIHEIEHLSTVVPDWIHELASQALNWERPLSSAAISAIIAATAFELATVAYQYLRERNAKKASGEAEFQNALESDNLEALGRYLSGEFGSIGLWTYSQDKSVRMRVDKCIEKLAKFVTPPGQEYAETVEPSDQIIIPAEEQRFPKNLYAETLAVQAVPDDPEPLRQAINDLANGEIWNALARLRRDIEKLLRGKLNISNQTVPLRQMFRMLPPGVYADLRTSIDTFLRIANSAIHGNDVDMGDAIYATQLARFIYRELTRLDER